MICVFVQAQQPPAAAENELYSYRRGDIPIRIQLIRNLAVWKRGSEVQKHNLGRTQGLRLMEKWLSKLRLNLHNLQPVHAYIELQLGGLLDIVDNLGFQRVADGQLPLPN